MNTYSIYWACQVYHYQVNGLLIQVTQGYNWRYSHWMCVCVYVCLCARAHVHLLSHVQLFEAPWTVAYQAPVPMEFFRWEYWSGVPFLTPGDLPDLEMQPTSHVAPALVKPQKRSIKSIILFDLILASIAFYTSSYLRWWERIE